MTQAVFYLTIIHDISVPEVNFKITVLDHKIKTSSTFLATENEGLDSPTGLSVFSN